MPAGESVSAGESSVELAVKVDVAVHRFDAVGDELEPVADIGANGAAARDDAIRRDLIGQLGPNAPVSSAVPTMPSTPPVNICTAALLTLLGLIDWLRVISTSPRFPATTEVT